MRRDDGFPERPDGPDPLDEILRAAVWPEPEPERLARLQRRWRELSAAALPRRWSAWSAAAVAVAAGLLVVIGLWRFLPKPGVEPKQVAPARVPETPASTRLAETPPAPPPTPDGPGDVDSSVPPPPRPWPVAWSRPARDYEQLAFWVVTHRGQPAAERTPDDLLERAIQQRLGNPDADPSTAARPLMADPRSYRRRLVQRIEQSEGPTRTAAIELLGAVGSRESLPLLVELSRDLRTRPAAVGALTRLADSDVLGQVISEESNFELQEELCAALLTRQDSRSLAVYLALVSRRQTTEVALAALDRVESPPVDLLFEYLRSPRYADRLAAAYVLGRLDRPDVSARLIHMARRGANRHEVLAALVASSDLDARDFVAAARKDPLLMGVTLAAESQVQSSFPEPWR
jgi:hypothetical protein